MMDTMGWEADVLFWIRDHLSCGFMDTLMPAVSLLCTADIIWFALALGLIHRRDTRRAGIILLVALVISILICNLFLKPMVGRIRPYEVYDVSLLVPASSEFSFPSGHTTGVTVVTMVVCMYLRRWMFPMVAFASLVMFSRMYLFMHYPTDIVGGVLVGMISVMLSYVIVESFHGRDTGGVKDRMR